MPSGYEVRRRPVIAEPPAQVRAGNASAGTWDQLARVGEAITGAATNSLHRAAMDARVAYLSQGELDDRKTIDRLFQDTPNDPDALQSALSGYRAGVVEKAPPEYVQHRAAMIDQLSAEAVTKARGNQIAATRTAAIDAHKALLERSANEAFAAASSGEDPAAALQGYSAILNAGMAAGYYSPERADLERDQAFGETVIERGLHEIDRAYQAHGAEAARAGYEAILGSDAAKALPPAFRQQALSRAEARISDLDREAAQQRAAASQAAAEEYARGKADFDIRAERGQLSQTELDRAYDGGTGWLRPADYATLTKSLDGQLEKALQSFAAFQRVEDAGKGGPFLDPNSAADQKAVDAHFAAVSAGWADKPPEERDLLTVGYVADHGIVPPSLLGHLRGALRKGSPSQQVQAAATIGLIEERAPWAAHDFDGSEFDLATELNLWTKAGAPPEEALARAQDALKSDPATREVRATAWTRQKYGDGNRAALLSRLADVPDSARAWYDPRTNAALPDAMAGEWDALVKDRFLATGDIDSARATAWRTMRRTWAVTDIGGRRFQRYAPEAIYANAAGTGWIGEQLYDDLAHAVVKLPADATEDARSAALEAEKARLKGSGVRLEVDPITARSAAPSYVVLQKNAGGEWAPVAGPDGKPLSGPDGRPLRFRPDWASSPAARSAVNDARDARAQMIDQQAAFERGQAPFDSAPRLPNESALELAPDSSLAPTGSVGEAALHDQSESPQRRARGAPPEDDVSKLLNFKE